MKMKNAMLVVLGSVLLAGVVGVHAQAQRFDKKTTITFSQAVQVPGQVLLAGTYTFTILNSSNSRSVVGIWDKDHTKLITKVLAIPNYSLKAGTETVIQFHEAAAGAPPAVKAWFYPGEASGREFVYPKQTAMQIAQANNEEVPAETTDVTPDTLKTVPVEAVTPQGKEEPLNQAFPAK